MGVGGCVGEAKVFGKDRAKRPKHWMYAEGKAPLPWEAAGLLM